MNENKNREFEKMAPDEYKEMKRNEKNEVFEMLSAATQKLMDPEMLKQYLDKQGLLLNMSVSNVLLIMEQKPDVTWLRTFDDWKRDDISLIKGEKGIKILESSFYQKRDGSMGRSSKVGKLFDVSQTTARELSVQKQTYKNVTDAIQHDLPVPIEPSSDIPEGSKVYYSPSANKIFVAEELSGKEFFNGMTRELTVIAMTLDGQRTREEVIPSAEMAAYMLSKRYGVESTEIDFERVAKHFPGMEEKDVRKELNEARFFAEKIDQKVQEYQDRQRESKEKDIDRDR